MVLATACAPNGGVDVATLEADLRAHILPEHAELIGAVRCPDPLKPEAGDQVVCDVAIGADIARVEVTFGAARGEIASATVLDRLVDVAEVGQSLSDQLTAQLELATAVTCPQEIMVFDADDSIVCTATDPRGVARDLAVTIDDDGALRLTLL